ncbi:MAG: ABC transporter permease subunit [Bacteroidia bacterium]|nr:ABC transporter permease subunit [Bacteroidia bacterium]MCZ2247234.1 ABC transporter permease [Bacteroidia bacterium]
MGRIFKYVMLDIFKNKIVIFYTILLAMLSWSAFSLEDNESKGLLTLLNIILLTVPLVSILFTTIYIYNSSEFVELLVSLPIKRKVIWNSLFIGLGLSLSLSFILGAGIPLLIYAEFNNALLFIAAGILTTLIFVALAFLSSILSKDKAKGIGVSIILWLYFALLFDGLILFLLYQLSEYPIEKMMVVITSLSPIDLARILILLNLDVSAMLGYTGAIFKDFFGTTQGLIISFGLLLLWIVIPYLISLRKFKKKDL